MTTEYTKRRRVSGGVAGGGIYTPPTPFLGLKMVWTPEFTFTAYQKKGLFLEPGTTPFLPALLKRAAFR